MTMNFVAQRQSSSERNHQSLQGRESELRQVFSLFKSRERKRLLVFGWMGIGKTAFILEALGVLQRKEKETLTAYISLPPDVDLATAAFIALARELDDDKWAQQQLDQIGIPPRKLAVKRKGKLEAGLPVARYSLEEETLSIIKPHFPALSFEGLLDRALRKHRRVVIAIDDLEKQDPARVRELLRNDQGLLKGGASFMLTGHPSGLSRDVLTSSMGLFDLTVELQQLDQPTTYRMLVNYLNSARAGRTKYEPDDPRTVRPFTQETARLLCERSDGVPRWLNRLASYVLIKADLLDADAITPEVLQQGFEYADQQLRGQPGLTPEDYYVLDLVLEKGQVSDGSVTLADLERLRAKEFNEILPILEKLVQMDLVRRLPTERAAEYQATPLLTPKSRVQGE